MKISAKTEYACVAMIELAASYERGEPVRVRTIAKEHGIPSRFLVQILLQLKGAGFVGSVRGASGGYRLQKSPREISLGEIMSVVNGHEELAMSGAAASPAAAVLREIWQEMARAHRKILNGTTLADLVHRARQYGEPMYYI